MISNVLKLIRPVAIATLAVIGYFQDIIFTSDVSNFIFLGIIGTSLFLDSHYIIEGYKDIFKTIKGGKNDK